MKAKPPALPCRGKGSDESLWLPIVAGLQSATGGCKMNSEGVL